MESWSIDADELSVAVKVLNAYATSSVNVFNDALMEPLRRAVHRVAMRSSSVVIPSFLDAPLLAYCDVVDAFRLSSTSQRWRDFILPMFLKHAQNKLRVRIQKKCFAELGNIFVKWLMSKTTDFPVVELSLCYMWNLRDDAVVPTLLRNTSSLTTVILSSNAMLTDDSLMPVADMASLTYLDVSRCRFITAEPFKARTWLPKLRVLKLSRCREMTNDGLVSTTSHVLQYLDLDWCDRLTQECFDNLATTCPALTTLALGRCTLVTSLNFVSHLHSLTRLDIDGCWGLDMTHVATCLDDHPCLKVLDISSFDHGLDDAEDITDEVMSTITTSCPLLQLLYVRDSPRLTPRGFNHIIQSLSHLTYLDVRGCPCVTPELLNNIARQNESYRSMALTIHVETSNVFTPSFRATINSRSQFFVLRY